jgi:hypothetical protein
MKRVIVLILVTLIVGACAPSSEKRDIENRTTEKANIAKSPPTVEAKPATTPLAYTEKEYQLYREVMESASSEPESTVFERLGKKYAMSSKEVKSAVERVQIAILSGGAAENRNREQAVRNTVEKLAQVKTVIVSGEFANVAYVEKEAALNDADVKRKVLDRMPGVLGAVFSVSGIDRVRLTAFYPTTDGGESKVASFEAYRSEFKTGKRPEEYRDFWVR